MADRSLCLAVARREQRCGTLDEEEVLVHAQILQHVRSTTHQRTSIRSTRSRLPSPKPAEAPMALITPTAVHFGRLRQLAADHGDSSPYAVTVRLVPRRESWSQCSSTGVSFRKLRIMVDFSRELSTTPSTSPSLSKSSTAKPRLARTGRRPSPTSAASSANRPLP